MLKDSNRPKWPKTPYMIFCKEKRVEHPNMKIPEFSKLMGAEWKKLSDQEKVPFIYKSVNERDRYAVEMKEYRAPSQEELVKRKKSSKEENLPKRPVSSYMYFCKDKRKEVEVANPGFEFKQVNSELGRMWREVFYTQEQRVVWIDLAEYDRKRYQEEMKSKLVQEVRQEVPQEELSIKEDLLVDKKRKLYNF
jgi:upstream-binding transcription factor